MRTWVEAPGILGSAATGSVETRTLPWVIGGLLCLWLALRLQLLRRRTEAALAVGEPEPAAPHWLRVLARRPFVVPLLLVGLAGCGLGGWLAYR